MGFNNGANTFLNNINLDRNRSTRNNCYWQHVTCCIKSDQPCGI